MIRTLAIASLVAAALTGGVVLFAAPSTEVKANTPSAKSDRHEVQQAKDGCSQHAWPYYPGDCIRDYRRSTGKASDVRVVFAGQLQTPK
jgi:hypothetical protein